MPTGTSVNCCRISSFCGREQIRTFLNGYESLRLRYNRPHCILCHRERCNLQTIGSAARQDRCYLNTKTMYHIVYFLHGRLRFWALCGLAYDPITRISHFCCWPSVINDSALDLPDCTLLRIPSCAFLHCESSYYRISRWPWVLDGLTESLATVVHSVS